MFSHLLKLDTFPHRLSNPFRYKGSIPKDLISGAVCKFQCGLCNKSYYGEGIRQSDIKSGGHIDELPLTGKKVKPSNNSAICDRLLHSKFFYLLLTDKKYLLEIKESLLIMRDRQTITK